MRSASGPGQRHATLVATLGAACLTVAVAAQSASAASPEPGAGDAVVAVQDFAFTPASVTIDVGASVVWTVRKDPEQHTVTPVVPGSFEGSGPLFAGDDFAVRFDAPGTYAYACRFHPFMTGTIVVVEAAAATAPAPLASPAPSAPVVPSDPVPTSSASAAEPIDGGPGVAPVLGAALVIVAIAGGLAGALLRRRRTG